MADLHLNFVTPMSLYPQSEGEQLLKLISDSRHQMAPDVYGYEDPVRTRFGATALKDAADHWESEPNFLWKRKRPRVDAGVWKGSSASSRHGWIHISVGAHHRNEEAIQDFFGLTSQDLCCDFAALDLPGEELYDMGRWTNTVSCRRQGSSTYSLMVNTHHLLKYVPDLYWATVFGPPYVSHFGREKLLASPAHIVRELAYGGVYIQLSENVIDLEQRFSEVDAVKQRVKKHLNQNSFGCVAFDLK